MLRKAKHSRDSIRLQPFLVKKLSPRKACKHLRFRNCELYKYMSRLILTFVLRDHACQRVVAKLRSLAVHVWVGLFRLYSYCVLTLIAYRCAHYLKVEKREAPSMADSEKDPQTSEQQFKESKGLCTRFRCRNFRQILRAHSETTEPKPRKQFENK